MADIELTGWEEFINKAGKLPDTLQQEFAGEVEFSAERWSLLAKQAAPKDQGRLVQGISTAKLNDLEWDVVSNAFYSPYLEFGTKSKVSIPDGLESYAALFKGSTGEKGVRVMIYAWMNRVGIPKESQWIVYISIMKTGIKAHPFLYPQEPVIEKEFIGHLQNIVDTEH